MIILGCACGGIGEMLIFGLVAGVLSLFGIKLRWKKHKKEEHDGEAHSGDLQRPPTSH